MASSKVFERFQAWKARQAEILVTWQAGFDSSAPSPAVAVHSVGRVRTCDESSLMLDMGDMAGSMLGAFVSLAGAEVKLRPRGIKITYSFGVLDLAEPQQSVANAFATAFPVK